MKAVANAFSLNMLRNKEARLTTSYVDDDMEWENALHSSKSFVGHKDLANMLGVSFNRENLTLVEGDVLYVAQVVGGRLPEGTTELPEGVKIERIKVEVMEA